MTNEEMNKIQITRETEIGDLCSYEGAHHKIVAENLAKWAYRRLETWPDSMAACRKLVRFCESKERLNEDGVCPVEAYELAKAAITKSKS